MMQRNGTKLTKSLFRNGCTCTIHILACVQRQVFTIFYNDNSSMNFTYFTIGIAKTKTVSLKVMVFVLVLSSSKVYPCARMQIISLKSYSDADCTFSFFFNLLESQPFRVTAILL